MNEVTYRVEKFCGLDANKKPMWSLELRRVGFGAAMDRWRSLRCARVIREHDGCELARRMTIYSWVLVSKVPT